MAFWAYMLRCADGKYYTGHSDDLERRLGEHRTGGYCDFTARRLPVELAWSETFGTRIEALEAERMVGGWSRAKKEALIAGNWSLVSHFARPPRERASAPAAHSPSPPFVSSEVEKPVIGDCQRFSTSLETNGAGEAPGSNGTPDGNSSPRVVTQ